MSKITKKILDQRLDQVASSVDYIEDPIAKNMIMKIVHVYHVQVLRALEHRIFARRTATVDEARAALYEAERRLDAAYNSGVGISAAADSVAMARERLDAAENVLLSRVDFDGDEIDLIQKNNQ